MLFGLAIFWLLQQVSCETHSYTLGPTSDYLADADVSSGIPSSGFSLENVNDNKELSMVFSKDLGEKLTLNAESNCAEPNSTRCINGVLSALNPDELDLRVRSIKPLIGLSTPKVKSNVYTWIVGLLALFWYLKSEDARGADFPKDPIINRVRLPAADISHVQTWSAGDTVIMGTAPAKTDAIAVTVTVASLPAEATRTCKEDPQCPEDHNRPLCHTCDGKNHTCTTGQCEGCKCANGSPAIYDHMPQEHFVELDRIMGQWLIGDLAEEAKTTCEIPRHSYNQPTGPVDVPVDLWSELSRKACGQIDMKKHSTVRLYVDGEEQFKKYGRYSGLTFHFEWKPSGAGCGLMTCEHAFEGFLEDEKCAYASGQQMNIGGARQTWCGVAGYHIFLESTLDLPDLQCHPKTPEYRPMGSRSSGYQEPGCNQTIDGQNVRAAAKTTCTDWSYGWPSGLTYGVISSSQNAKTGYPQDAWGRAQPGSVYYMFYLESIMDCDAKKALPVFDQDECEKALISAWSSCPDNNGLGGTKKWGCYRLTFEPTCYGNVAWYSADENGDNLKPF